MADEYVDQLEAAIREAHKTLQWLADWQPDCLGWEAPFPSKTSAIQIAADRLLSVLKQETK